MSGAVDGAPFGVRALDDLPDIRGRSVLVRATLDRPLAAEGGSPLAALRLRRLSDTVRALAARGASITVFGETALPGLGFDEGRDREVRRLVEAMGASVAMSAPSAEEAGTLAGLIRSHHAFVNDSFQWSYLPLPSLMLPAEQLPAAAGKGLMEDLRIASALLRSPQRPFGAILGGGNSLLRLHGLQGLVLRTDEVLVGGALSRPMLEATGKRPASAGPAWFLDECRAVVGLAERVQHRIHLPVDVIVRRPDGTLHEADPNDPTEGEIVDIGPLTAKRYAEAVQGMDTVVWTGALGLVEDEACTGGTLTVGRSLPVGTGRRVVLGGDALVGALAAAGLGEVCELASATDSLLELFKTGDLAALAALRGAQNFGAVRAERP